MIDLTPRKDLPPVPFKAIFTSVPFWALMSAQVGHNYGIYVAITDLPKYMNDVLKLSIKENGLYSSLPFLTMFLVAQVVGFISDFIIKRKYLGVTNVRKLFTVIAAYGPAIFIVVASYSGCDEVLVVIWFTVGLGVMGTFYSGFKVNNLDLAPNYAGVLMALTNGAGGITGIIVPYLTGLLTPDVSVKFICINLFGIK